MSNSSTRHYPTVPEANHGFEMAVSGEPDSNLPAFLDVESFDEWDMKSPRSPMEPQIPYEELKWFEREVAANANASTRPDSDLPARPHCLLNAGPPDQLLPPALLQDQHLWSSEELPSSGSPTTNIRPSLYPWSVRDNNPRDLALPQLTLTGAFSKLPNLAPASARADRERRLNRAQRREPAAVRTRTCKHCGVYVWGSRRRHDKSHCMAFEKENIDPN